MYIYIYIYIYIYLFRYYDKHADYYRFNDVILIVLLFIRILTVFLHRTPTPKPTLPVDEGNYHSVCT